MEFGFCGSIGSAAGLGDSGLVYIEVGVQEFLVPLDDDEAFEANLKHAEQCPLPIRAANGFIPGTLRSTGPDANHDGILEYAATAFRRAEQVGIESIVFGSGGSRKLEGRVSQEEAMAQFSELLSKLGPLAEPHNVTVVIEPLNTGECDFINSLAEGAEAAQRANHPNIQLLADFYHMLRDDEPASEVAAHGSIIKHCHLAEKVNRTCPGIEGDDFRPFFKGLKDVGYTGRISIEGKFPDGLEVDAPVAVAEMRQQLEDA